MNGAVIANFIFGFFVIGVGLGAVMMNAACNYNASVRRIEHAANIEAKRDKFDICFVTWRGESNPQQYPDCWEI